MESKWFRGKRRQNRFLDSRKEKCLTSYWDLEISLTLDTQRLTLGLQNKSIINFLYRQWFQNVRIVRFSPTSISLDRSSRTWCWRKCINLNKRFYFETVYWIKSRTTWLTSNSKRWVCSIDLFVLIFILCILYYLCNALDRFLYWA